MVWYCVSSNSFYIRNGMELKLLEKTLGKVGLRLIPLSEEQAVQKIREDYDTEEYSSSSGDESEQSEAESKAT